MRNNLHFTAKYIPLAAILLLFSLIPAVIFPQDYSRLLQASEPLPLTTHPAEDYQCAISAKGDFMVFVSTRSGQEDIWLKSFSGGVPRRLTFHSSEDYEPDVDSGGKRIVFLSKRDNALGKIYLATLGGAPKQLTFGPGEEHSPRFAPDGARVTFSKTRADSEVPDIYLLELGKGKEPRKIIENGVNPSYSPDGNWLVYAAPIQTGAAISLYSIQDNTSFELSDGMTIDTFPVFSRDSQTIFFYRYSGETNGDKEINMHDYPHLVKIDLGNLQETKLTTPNHFDYYPAVGSSRLYFTRRKGETTDIFNLGLEGLVPLMPSAGEQFTLAMAIKKTGLKRLALEQVERYFPKARREAVQALLALGELESGEGDYLGAWQAYQRLQDNYPGLAEEAALAHVYQLRINRKLGSSTDVIIKRLLELSIKYRDFPKVMAEIKILEADIRLSLGQLNKALTVYQSIPASFPQETIQAAQAYFKRGQVLSQLKFSAAAQENYLKVIVDYPAAARWADLALGRLLADVKAETSREKRLSSYRKIIELYPQSAELFARVSTVIAEEYENSGDYDLALQEYEKILKRLAENHSFYFIAAFQAGKIYQQKKDDESAITLFRRLFNFPEPEKRKKAKQQAASIYFAQGNKAIEFNDFALAASYFEQVLDIFPAKAEAYRQLVKCYARRGKIDQFITLVKNSLALNPDSAILHYALGLSFTYKGAEAYPFALKELDKAIELNNRLLPAYLAAGWIYEQKLIGERQRTGSVNEAYYQAFLDNYGLARAINDQKANPALEADINLALGNISYFNGNFQLAALYYQKRLDLPLEKPDIATEALFYRNFGRSLCMLSRFDRAMTFYEKAAAIHQGNKDWEKYVQILALEAFAQEKANKYTEAINLYQKTLTTIKEKGLSLPKYIIYANIGRNFYLMGEEAEAVPFLRQALRLLETEKETRQTQEGLLRFSVQVGLEGKKSTAVAGFSVAEERKLIHSFLAKIHLASGDYGAATNQLKEKLKILSPTTARDERAISLNNLGYIYYLTNQLDKANEMFQPSLAAIRRHDPYGKLVNFLNLAQLAVRESHEKFKAQSYPAPESFEMAIKYGEKSLGVIKDIDPENDSGQADNLLGTLHFLRAEAGKRAALDSQNINQVIRLNNDSLKDYFQAENNWRRALLKVEKQNNPAAIALIRFNLVNLERTLGVAESALKTIEELLTTAADNDDRELQWRLLKLKGEMLRKVDPQSYKELLLEAMEKYEEGYFLSRYEGRGLEPEISELYQAIIDSYLAEKDYQNAVTVLERKRQYKLIQFTAKKRLRFKSELDNITARDIEYHHEQLAGLRYKNTPSARERRQEFWREYQALKKNTMKESPDLAALYWGSPISVEKTQSLLSPTSVFVDYQLTETGINIFLLSKDSLRYFYSRLESDGISPLISSYLAALLANKDYQVSGEKLAALLFKPLAEELGQFTRLYIITTGELSRLPFASLPFRDGYLIDHFELAFSHSRQSWLASYQKRNINYTSHLIYGLAAEKSELAKKAHKRFFETTSKTFLNQKRAGGLRGGELLEKVASYGIVSWFSVFGVNPINPWENGLIFEEEVLTNSQLFQTHLNNALLVFPRIGGDGGKPMPDVQLFTTALLYGGCPQVVLAGWRVDTGSQLKFLEELYTRLNSQPEAQAIREAMLSLKNSQPEPLNWAGFQLYGYGGISPQNRQKLQKDLYADTVQQALKAFAKKKWEVALNLFELASRMSEGENTVQPEERERIFSAIVAAGSQSGAYAKAAQYQKKLVEIAQIRKHPGETIKALNKLLYLQGEAGRFEEALSTGEGLIAYLKKMDNPEKLAEAYNNLGRLLRLKKDYPQAKAYFQESIDLCDKLGLQEKQAQNFFDRANLKLLELDDYQGALADYEVALKIYRELEMASAVIQVTLGEGRAWLKSGKYLEALMKAKTAARAAKQKKDEALFTEALLDQASANWYLGDHAQAKELTANALHLSREQENLKLELMARTLRGLILNDEKKYSEALYEQGKAVELAKTIRDDRDLASAYNNLGLTQRQSGQLAPALSSFERALALDQKLNSLWGQMYDYRNLGITTLYAGEAQMAKNYLQQALSLARQIDNLREITLNLLFLGTSWQSEDAEQAKEYFKETAALAKKYAYDQLHWRALYNLGVIAENLQTPNEAFSFYRKAMTVLAQSLPPSPEAVRRYDFNETPSKLYERAIALGWQLEKYELAFQYGEQAKGLPFLSLVINQEVPFQDGQTAKTYAQFKRLWRQSHNLRRRIAEASEKAVKTELEKKLSATLRAKQGILTAWRAQAPNLYYLVRTNPPTVSSLQQNLRASEALIAYYLAPKALYVWFLTTEEIKMYQVPLPETQLLALISAYRAQVQKTADYQELSNELYQRLIMPLQAELSGKKLLFIVPHKNLHYLPFSSLYDGKNFLVEKYLLTLLPQAGLLSYCRQLKPRKLQKVLAFGNPALAEPDREIPFSEKEVKSIRRSFPESTVLVKTAATESAFKNQAGDYQAIHFGSHGELAPLNPMFSSLELAADEKNDGHLRVGEILGLDLAAQVVTLSACQSGLGAEHEGEEISGMNRAFLFAGTPRVVSTLWRINDVTAAILTKRYYRYLVKDNSVVALQKAQLLVKKYYPHPVYWAAFALTGAP